MGSPGEDAAEKEETEGSVGAAGGAARSPYQIVLLLLFGSLSVCHDTAPNHKKKLNQLNQDKKETKTGARTRLTHLGHMDASNG